MLTNNNSWDLSMGRCLSVLAALLYSVAAWGYTPGGVGKAVYESRCAPCHGADGKGAGVGTAVLTPRPRNFTSGKFKFRTTESGSIPTDADLERAITNGLGGTAMPGWKEFLS